MKISKIRLVVYISAALVGVLLLAAGVLYYLASSVPEDYRPANLTAKERKREASKFWDHLLSDFNGVVQKTVPGEWHITQEQLNDYLASMDEIAAVPPDSDRRGGDVNRQLDLAGLAAPAAKLDNGVLTLMIRVKEHNKVISADIAFVSTADSKLEVKLVAVRVGNLTVPKGFLRDRVNELKASLAQRAKSRKAKRPKPAGNDDRRRATLKSASIEDVQSVLAGVISAIDEPPTRRELVWPFNRKRFRIDKVEITKGRAVLHITPLGRAKRKG